MSNRINKILFLILLMVSVTKFIGETKIFPALADEVIIGIILIFNLGIKNIDLKSKFLLYSVIGLTLLSTIGILISASNNIPFDLVLHDLIEIYKFVLFFGCICIIKIDDDLMRFVNNSYFYLSVFSMLIGIMQWYLATFKGVYWGVSMYRERQLGIRIEGTAGHNIAMGYTMMIFIYLIIEKMKNKTFSIKLLYFSLLLCALFALMVTGSRLPIMSFFVFCLYKYLYLNVSKRYRFPIACFALVLFALFLIQSGNQIVDKYSTEEDLTIRYQTIMMGLTTQKPVFGYGLGEYLKIFPSITYGVTREAFMFELLFEVGIVGLILFYSPFIYASIKLFKEKNKSAFLFLFLGVIFQSVFNGFYQMSIYFYAAIICGYHLNNCKKNIYGYNL